MRAGNTMNNNKQAWVPKLRFPEFRGTGGWKKQLGNNLFDQISDKKPWPGLPVLAITQEHGAIPRHMIDYHVSVTEKSIESYKVVQVGDFIISLRSFQGGIEYSQYQGICSPAYVVLRRRGGGSDAYFRHYLKTDRFIQILTKNLEGLRDGKMISYKQFSELQIPVPVSEEQQKIADCLSSLDELITAQARKVGALKTHKKGLMQQLFPREGETQPRLRFPEFQGAGEWTPTALGSIASFSSGGTPSKDNPEYWNGSIPWVSASSMYELHISKADHYVTPLAIGNGTRIAKKGTLLILVRGSMLFKRVPMCIAAVDVAFNQDVKALKIDPSIIGTFLIYQLLTNEARIPINETGIGAGKIELTDLKEFGLFIPSQPEQCRIADSLTNLDDLITAATQELDTLKTHKKGLMQQLFPSAAAVET